MPGPNHHYSCISCLQQQWTVIAILLLAANLIRMVQFDLIHSTDCNTSYWTRPGSIEQTRRVIPISTSSSAINRSISLQDSDASTSIVRTVDETERDDMQRVYAEASAAFQRLFTETQLSGDCEAKTVVRYSPTTHNAKSTLFEINEIAASLLTALAASKPTVLSLEGIQLPQGAHSADCVTYDCLIQPISTCAVTKVQPSSKLDDQCIKDDIVRRLVQRIELQDSPNAKLLDWSFFVRESLRAILRPSERLSTMIRELRTNQFSPLDGWQPFERYASRVAVHLPGMTDQSMYERFPKGLKIQVAAQSGTGLNQVLIRADRASRISQFQTWLNVKEPSSERDWQSRSAAVNAGTIPVIPTSLNAKTDSALLMLAQGIVFAECDYFVGDFNTNFARFVGQLMRLMRHSAFAPAWDIRGSPFVPIMAADQAD